MLLFTWRNKQTNKLQQFIVLSSINSLVLNYNPNISSKPVNLLIKVLLEYKIERDSVTT